MDTSSPQAYLASGGTLTNGQIPSQSAPTGASQNDPVLVPTAPTSISSASMAPTPAPILQPSQPTPNYAGITSSIPTIATIESNNNIVNTPEGQKQQAINSRLESLMGSLGDKTAYQQQQYNQAGGVTDITGQLNDLGTQITTLKNNAAAIPLQDQNAAAGKGITVAGLAPKTAGELRTNAIQALTLNSLASTLQGKLSTAKAAADQAVALKYDPIENEIKVAQQQITDNLPFFTAAEQKIAATTQAQLADRLQQVAHDREDATAILGYANDAAKNGASNLQAQQIAKAPDITSAFALYAPYAKDPAAAQKALDAHLLARSEINKNNADAVKLANDAKIQQASNVDIPSVISTISNPNETRSELGGLTLNGLTQKAKIYMTNGGNIQGLGLSNSGNSGVQRTLIANYGAYLADKAGLDIPQMTALYKSNSKAATDVIGRLAKIDTTSSTLTGQFPRLAQLATSVGNLGITESDLTKGKAEIARKFGSVDAGNYAELIQTVRSDYAAMQAAVGGSKGGQFFAQNAQEAIPLGLTAEQYLGLAQTIKQSADIASQSSGAEVQKLIGGTQTQNSSSDITLKDPKTGETRLFKNMSANDLNEALTKGYLKQ